MNLYAVTIQLFSGKIVTTYEVGSNGGAAAWEAVTRWDRCLVVGVPRFCGSLATGRERIL
jgi:hypothetical protein